MVKKTEKEVKIEKVLTEDEQKLLELKSKIREIKNKGKFKGFYTELRKKSYEVFKTKGTDEEKKKMLVELFEDLTNKINPKVE